MEEFYIDTAGQIHNKWGAPTVLAIVSKNRKIRHSIRIDAAEKKSLKDVYIRKEKTKKSQRHNNRIIALIFAYMIFRLVDLDYKKIKKIIICPDHRPVESVYRFLLQIASKYGHARLSEDIEIKFRNIAKKSVAHKHALSCYRKKVNLDIVLKKKEISEIKSLIQELILAKMM